MARLLESTGPFLWRCHSKVWERSCRLLVQLRCSPPGDDHAYCSMASFHRDVCPAVVPPAPCQHSITQRHGPARGRDHADRANGPRILTCCWSPMATQRIACLLAIPAPVMRRSICMREYASGAPCMCRTSTLITADCGNGWRHFMALPRAICRTISVGAGYWTQSEYVQRPACSKPCLDRSHI